MQKLCRERRFKPRACMALHSVFGKPVFLEDNEHLLALGYQTGPGDEFFRVGSCKFMIDGGIRKFTEILHAKGGKCVCMQKKLAFWSGLC